MRASDRAYRAIVEEIQSGELAPGAVIGEVEQSARLGVSRTPMREAIARLVADGLVRQQSARVLVVAGFDAADIRALFETRRALEETAARLAAARGNRARFAALAADFRAARPEANNSAADDYYALIARFDEALDTAVDNAYLTQALRPIRAHLARARRIARDNADRLRASVTEHALIADAIARGDAELAAHATHVHLHHALAAILSSIAASPVSEGPA
ncbi:GntR family transcriptional regulator [Leucobacter luti]|uniref:GntR family transcriptional regulator n=1 Tax=Leucobacter luti TaxID=340320 RepID=A0A4R6S5K7_9MICO|nr:GntR family transcriptional regulator [Leucobacter luti]MCW2287379.1 DNA-binding GntR family transcriptional regulator [Leucobacter luti]QYM76557.1 GntR family transcriptional regulator [Leucobacter luti]TCK41601.1 GntR family transcriptional regulator [Leucobacter luti]TDP94584.1 GntR family transcriptional regulator [Leucobacter luti]